MVEYQEPTSLPLREPPSHYSSHDYAPPSYQTATGQTPPTTEPMQHHMGSSVESGSSRSSQDVLEHWTSADDKTQTISVEEQKVLEQNLASIPKPLPSSRDYPPLQQIIGIPQIAIGSFRQPPMPFERVYAPTLATYGISKTDFLKIVDSVNICLSQAAPFQVLQGASTVVGFVPHHWATGVSAGLGAVAGVGNAVTIKVRTKKFFEQVNRQIWAPRGLKMIMLKGQEMLDVLGVSETQAWQLMDKSPAYALEKRRLEALKPYLALLDWDVPTQETPQGLLDRLSAKQQQRKATKRDKKQEERLEKAEEKQAKRERKAAKRGLALPERRPMAEAYDSSSDSSDSDGSSIMEHGNKIDKHHRKRLEVIETAEQKLMSATEDKKRREIEKKRDEKLEDIDKEIRKEGKDLTKKQREFDRKSDKRVAKREEKAEKKDDKERKKINKLRWIIIRPLTDADRAAAAAKSNSS